MQCGTRLSGSSGTGSSNVLEGRHWLLWSDAITEDEFYQHHIQAVTRAIQNAKNRGVAITMIGFRGFDLPHFRIWREPDLRILSESLRQLLDGVKV